LQYTFWCTWGRGREPGKGSGNGSFPCRKIIETVGFYGEPEIASRSASRVRVLSRAPKNVLQT
jgi:hypothetical protein